MYHEISPMDASGPGNYFSVPRARFAAQLDLLGAMGLQGASMERVAASPNGGLVAITFDDGHASDYAEAFPELAARGMSATFFVVTSRVGQPGYVTWPHLREMSSSGMSIQSHTHTHPFLSELTRAQALDELRTSKRLLDDALAQDTISIAFPGGDAPRGWSANDFVELGYEWIATSRWGPNSRVPRTRAIRRYTVRRDGDASTFERMAHAASSAWSPEAVRLLTLNVVRRALGPSRYATMRRRALGVIGR
jgi:peptidoglycan/xylan/chitin deacetylase (PgdA/CDA1 family)